LVHFYGRPASNIKVLPKTILLKESILSKKDIVLLSSPFSDWYHILLQVPSQHLWRSHTFVVTMKSTEETADGEAGENPWAKEEQATQADKPSSDGNKNYRVGRPTAEDAEARLKEKRSSGGGSSKPGAEVSHSDRARRKERHNRANN
jgi:hypothetical protein